VSGPHPNHKGIVAMSCEDDAFFGGAVLAAENRKFERTTYWKRRKARAARALGNNIARLRTPDGIFSKIERSDY
jgi:hypothetical protein